MSTITEAFQVIKRVNFVPAGSKPMAGLDLPLSIGYGQTNSQPTTIRLMLEWLDLKPGQKVLDVGSGSGWSSALLGHLVEPTGTVYAVERIPELVDYGRHNCHNLGLTNVEFFMANDEIGLPQQAPFDRILVSADTDEFPDGLIDQLKVNGKIVAPINGIIYEITKLPKGRIKTKENPGFIFVPLIK
jgi:protein-L-isoaspartate(D-aspartate) O-methyltransferase